MTITEKINLAENVLTEIKTTANIIARANHMGAATGIIKGELLEVVRTTDFGYRKNSDDSYVSNTYRDHFGWKNTYYQNAECVVSIPETLSKKAEKWEEFLVLCPEFTERRFSIFGGLIN